MAFPMYVVRAASLLAMTWVEPHQVLKARGELVQYRSSADGVAAFVSHQWCANSHPDPDFRQLIILQRVLLHASRGTLAIRGDLGERFFTKEPPSITLRDWADAAAWMLWYDYFSIPQDLGSDADGVLADCMVKAIASLAEYVAASRYFIVLAPSVSHEDGSVLDYESWKRRGWCRFERLAKVLTCRAKAAILLVRNDRSVFEVGAEACFVEPVGYGDFTDAKDRERLGPRVQKLLETKLHRSMTSGNKQEYCHWLGVRATLLRGLPRSAFVAKGNGAGELLRQIGCKSAAESVAGISPLLVASAVGDIPAMETLIARKANVSCKQPVEAPAFLLQKGMQPIHFAAMHGHSMAVTSLLWHRAKVSTTSTSSRATPAHFAASFGHIEALQTLLEHRADIDAKDAMQTSLIAAAIATGRVEALRWLVSAGASVAADEHGVTPLNYVAYLVPRRDIVEVLVGAGVSMERRFQPQRGSFIWWVFKPLILSYSLGRRDFFSLLGYHLRGATPLHISAAFGNVVVVRALLDCRADPLSRTDSGLTMAEVYSLIDPTRHPLAELLDG